MTSRYIFLRDPNGYDVEILERDPDVDAGPASR